MDSEPTMNPIVSPRNIALLLPFCGQTEEHYYLQGIRIEPHRDGGCLMIATDGHALGIYHDADAKAEAPLTWMPSRTLLSICGFYRDRWDGQIEDVISEPDDGAMIELTSPTWGKALEPVDGKDLYPPWRNLLPETFPTPTAPPFNLKILAKFARANTRFLPLGITPSSPLPGGKGDVRPSYVFPLRNEPFFGVVMPMRINAETTRAALPDWLKP